jgi:hypothetical protein
MTTTAFDRLARILANPRHSTIAGTAAAGVSSPALAAAAAARTCVPLNADATCSPGWRKEPKPNNEPTDNGCGPESWTVKPPQGYGGADYRPACRVHDHCYENCAMSQKECDDDFLGGMVASCTQAYSNNVLDRGWCMSMAVVYWQVVSQGGKDDWRAAQQKACECCATAVYCACNKTCYDDVNVCLAECKTSLGCFTGICGPAQPGQCG